MKKAMILLLSAIITTPISSFANPKQNTLEEAYFCTLALLDNTDLFLRASQRMGSHELLSLYRQMTKLLKEKPELAGQVTGFVSAYLEFVKVAGEKTSEILRLNEAQKLLTVENSAKQLLWQSILSDVVTAARNEERPDVKDIFYKVLEKKELFALSFGTLELKPFVKAPAQLTLSADETKKLFEVDVLSRFRESPTQLFDQLPKSFHGEMNDLLRYMIARDAAITAKGGHFASSAYYAYERFLLDFFEQAKRGFFLEQEMVSPAQYKKLLEATPDEFLRVVFSTFSGDSTVDRDPNGRVLRLLRANYQRGAVNHGVAPEVREFLGLPAPGSMPEQLPALPAIDPIKREQANAKFQELGPLYRTHKLTPDDLVARIKEIVSIDTVTAALFSETSAKELAREMYFRMGSFENISFERAVLYMRLIYFKVHSGENSFEQSITAALNILATDPVFGTRLTALQRELLAFDFLDSRLGTEVYRVRWSEEARNLPTIGNDPAGPLGQRLLKLKNNALEDSLEVEKALLEIVAAPSADGRILANVLYVARLKRLEAKMLETVFSAVFDAQNVAKLTDETFLAAVQTADHLDLSWKEKLPLLQKIIRNPAITRAGLSRAIDVPFFWIFGVRRLRAEESDKAELAKKFAQRNWNEEMISETVAFMRETAALLKQHIGENDFEQRDYEYLVDYLARHIFFIGVTPNPDQNLYQKLWKPFFDENSTVSTRTWMKP